MRLTHRLWHVRHSAKIYVDDLLAILLRSSAPLLSALLVVLLCVLRVPMSWRKAALSAKVTWIGWSFDFDTFAVELDPSKLRWICSSCCPLRLVAQFPPWKNSLASSSGSATYSSHTGRPSLHFILTSTVRCRTCAPYRLTYMSLYVPRCLMTLESLRLSRLQPSPWAANFSVLRTHPCPACVTCPSPSRPGGYGFKFPIPSVRSGNYLLNLKKCFACGFPLPVPRPKS